VGELARRYPRDLSNTWRFDFSIIYWIVERIFSADYFALMFAGWFEMSLKRG
jgi:hypothetical protein